MGEMFIWSKLDQNPSEIDVGSYARIKNVIWDHLRLKLIRVKLSFRVCAKQEAEIIQSQAIFSCLCKTGGLKGIFNALNKELCLVSAMECAEGNNTSCLLECPYGDK